MRSVVDQLWPARPKPFFPPIRTARDIPPPEPCWHPGRGKGERREKERGREERREREREREKGEERERERVYI